MKVYKSINEFLANKPGIDPSKPGISPDVKPGTPKINPKFPSPIRRDKPKVKPDPKAGIETILPTATEEEVIAKLISNLRSNKGEIEVNLAAIKNKYKK
jgi:hypothetical protein